MPLPRKPTLLGHPSLNAYHKMLSSCPLLDSRLGSKEGQLLACGKVFNHRGKLRSARINIVASLTVLGFGAMVPESIDDQ